MVSTKTLLLKHYYRHQGFLVGRFARIDSRCACTFSADQFWAAKRGCFKRGGCPIWTCPSFLSFLVLSRFFRDFPDLLGDGPGIFPIRPLSFSRPIKSTYEEQSRKGPRHNLDLSRKKWETPGFGNPPV